MTPIDVLDGVWQVEMAVVTRTSVPVLGDSRTTSYSLLIATIAGGVQRQQLCDTWMEDRNLFAKVWMPPAFIAAYPIQTFAFQLVVEAGSMRYRVDQGDQAVGFDGAGAVPERAADPGVRDWEGDGRPGATVKVKVPFAGEGEVWVAQRGRTVLDGLVVSADRVEGGVRTLDFDQHVLGASNGLLDLDPTVYADDAASTFVMTRMPAGSTCGTLPAARTGIGAERRSPR